MRCVSGNPRTTPRSPRTNLFETTDGWHLIVALPGVEREAIELETRATTLRLKAPQRHAEGEQPEVIYERELDFPRGVEWGDLKAEWRAGLLKVTLKRATPITRQITIS